jgi:zinc D-Ala-D-Ala carboxypeptidase
LIAFGFSLDSTWVFMPLPNDIPVAQRINGSANQSRATVSPLMRALKALPWWAYGLAVLAFFLPAIALRVFVAPSETSSNTNNQKPIAAATSPASNSGTAVPNPTGQSPTSTTAGASEQIFGHLAYPEAPPSTLRSISRASDGYEIRLRDPAAQAFLNMVTAARVSGVELVAISGFRTVDDQKKLFFDISKERNQTPAQRAMVSAPPGYSEHHTGYAIDIGDGNAPSSNLSTDFDKTAAYRWLEQNGAQFGFELSFPPNNPQGVSYEPWHWRFVGDIDSLAIFHKNQPQSQNNSRSSALIR